jgi:hypothetical protein
MRSRRQRLLEKELVVDFKVGVYLRYWVVPDNNNIYIQGYS